MSSEVAMNLLMKSKDREIVVPDFYGSSNLDSDIWNDTLIEKKRLDFYSYEDGYSYGYVSSEPDGFYWTYEGLNHYEVHEKGAFDLFYLHYFWEFHNNLTQDIHCGNKELYPAWIEKSRFTKLCQGFEKINKDSKVYFLRNETKIHYPEWDASMGQPLEYGRIRMRYVIESTHDLKRYYCMKFNQLLEFTYSYSDWGRSDRFLLGNSYFGRENPLVNQTQ